MSKGTNQPSYPNDVKLEIDWGYTMGTPEFFTKSLKSTVRSSPQPAGAKRPSVALPPMH